MKVHRHAPVTLSEERGLRYLHLGTDWIQGAMRLADPDAIALEYVRQMMAWTLFLDAPRAVAQLGLGAAALTKFCLRRFPDARVVAVELNPAVVLAAHAMFALPADPRLEVVLEDAAAFVARVARHGRFDAIQVDLYDAAARGPVLDSPEFYAGVRACLAAPGVATINLFGAHRSFGRNLRALRDAFDGRVVALPEVHEGNRIALAFNGPPLAVAWSALRRRAQDVGRAIDLPATRWVRALQSVAVRRGDVDTFRI